MRNKRFRFRDRRQNIGTLRVPFNDSHGATVKECRRKMPDRRVDSIQAALVNLVSDDRKTETTISNIRQTPAPD